MIMAGMSSRAPVDTAAQTFQDDEVLIHGLVENLRISAVRISEMKEATREDIAILDRKDIVIRGWPKYKKNASLSIRQY